VLFVIGYRHAGGADQSVHQPAGAQQFMLLVAVAIIIVNGLLIVSGPTRATCMTSYSFDSFQIGPLIIVDKVRLYAGGAAWSAAALFAFFRFTADRQGDPRLRRQLHRRAGGRPERQAALRADLRARRGLRRRRRLDAAPDRRRDAALGPAYTLLAFVIVIVGGSARCRARCSAAS
jgi:branched-chain amino acid transport system permease protein